MLLGSSFARSSRVCLSFTRLGMAYVHAQGLIHRDIKPQNLFLATGDVLKIGDFGLATARSGGLSGTITDTMDSRNASLTSEIGTPVYAAPETLSSGKYSAKVDVYSIGICFFEMIYLFNTKMARAVCFFLKLFLAGPPRSSKANISSRLSTGRK
jgi:serine/threonine protein kinase